MKLQVMSDLHVEFGPVDVPPTPADVLVLAGDIDLGLKGLGFAVRVAGGRPVVYVAGNHEYYGHAIPHLTRKLVAAAEGTGIHFLESAATVIGGVRFLGCTLWTDFAAFPARALEAMEFAQSRMSDYRRIRKSPAFGRLRPAHTVHWHQASRLWLRRQLSEPFAGATVVVTHHAPSLRSSDPRFRDDLLSAAFVSDVEELINGHQVALWIHGHTHHCVDYVLNGTRVVSNQRGYPDELVRGFDGGLVVEV